MSDTEAKCAQMASEKTENGKEQQEEEFVNPDAEEKQLLQKVFSRKFAANKAKKETKSDQWFELNIY